MIIGVAKKFVIFEKVVNDELLLPNVGRGAGPATAHLLVKNRGTDAAAHHEIEEFAAVEPGIEHSH